MKPAALVMTIGVMAAARLGTAAPLAQKWRVAGCQELAKRTPTELVVADRKSKTIVRRDLATGKLLPALPLATAGKSVALAEATAATLVLDTGGTFVGVDAATGKQRWSVAGKRAIRIDDDFALATAQKAKVTVQRIGGTSGARAWSADVPVAGKGELYSYAFDGAHVVVGIKEAKAFTVVAIDAKTGAIAWTAKLAVDSYHGAIVGPGTIVVEEKTQDGAASAFHLLDAATGKVAGKVEYKNAFAPAVGAGRLYVGTNDLDTRKGTLVAVDARTAKPVWSVTTASVNTLDGVGASGLVVETAGVRRVVDVATGKQVATFGLPQRENLALGDRGGPAITTCDGKETLALDLGGTDETAKVTGKIACKDCDATTFPVALGDATGTTDKTGAFTLTLVGAGRYELEVPLEENGGIIGGTGKYVQLAGKGTYDLGTIKIAQPVLGD